MTLLTAVVQEQITAAIRAGGFPEVAAQAFGVSRRTFADWRKRGQAGEEPFSSFSEAVDTAIAQARLRAEMSVFEEQPRIWLQHGPGRETNRQRGWTVAVKPRVAERTTFNFLMSAEFQQFSKTMLESLADEPRAREKLSKVAILFGEPGAN